MASRYQTLSKGNELLEILRPQLSTWQRARVKFVVLFVLAVIKVGLHSLTELAGAFDNKAQVSSVLRRIRRFLLDFGVDHSLVARLIVSLMDLGAEPWILSLDRTEWKFGKKSINFLVLSIAYKGIAIPVLWAVWNKQGNSDFRIRIVLLQRFIQLFGRDRIKALVADREFVGNDWFNYLSDYQIPYYMRISG